MNQENMIEFMELAYERHKIYVLKSLGLPKPWTKDPIFKNSFFCNVFRKIDKTTVWIVENVIDKYPDHPTLWRTVIMLRVISRISTFEKLENIDALFDYKKAYDLLRTMQSNKEPILTGAFIINSVGFKPGPTDKVSYIFMMLNWLTERGYGKHFKGTLQNAFKELIKVPGIGGFMAYEYVTDLTYCNQYLKNSKDLNTWMNYGLGAVRGMNRLRHNAPSSKKCNLKDALEIYEQWKFHIKCSLANRIEKTYAKTVLETYLDRADKELLQPHLKNPEKLESGVNKLYEPFRNLTLREVEHWLCEYDKYKRGGSSKRSYDGN